MSFLNKLRTQKALSFTLILFTLSVGIVIGTLVSSGVKAAKGDGAAMAPGATALTIPNPVELSNTFTQIAKQVGPSVVNISTTYLPKATARPRSNNRRQVAPPDDEEQSDNGGMDDLLNRFFSNPFGGGGPDMSSRKGFALGSGVVVDKAGYILTNNHVVDKADRIQVKFTGDPTDYDAKVVGTDVQTDLAVIRVEGKKDLVPAKIGNSDAVQVGDWAMAIGSPFGFQATVTAGIISAKERDIPGDTSQFQHFLQTDAAINPGNSGGPLLNIRGEVVGINTAIASRSGGYQGVGFALPINAAAHVYNDIIKTGKVTRGSIGIKFTPSDTDRARASLKVAGVKEGGVFVEQVAPGGPSDKAGMKEADVIVSVNGKPIHDGGELINIVTSTTIGDSLNIGVDREGKRESLKVVVGDLAQIFPKEFGNPNDEASKNGEATTVSFGMQIQNLTDRQRDTLGVKVKSGVQVVSVEPNSFAEDVGLQQGDIIVSINRHEVAAKEDITKIRDTLKPGDAVQFRVMRRVGRGTDWAATFVAGTLSANGR
ncbi:MAG TPA: Do family serine endopeptidase [Candidatus Solibacter sp.]|nr:Do family serine endopeptidase [Candidatus Solibacter sp.]